jgi:hypothetical protein
MLEDRFKDFFYVYFMMKIVYFISMVSLNILIYLNDQMSSKNSIPN